MPVKLTAVEEYFPRLLGDSRWITTARLNKRSYTLRAADHNRCRSVRARVRYQPRRSSLQQTQPLRQNPSPSLQRGAAPLRCKFVTNGSVIFTYALYDYADRSPFVRLVDFWDNVRLVHCFKLDEVDLT